MVIVVVQETPDVGVAAEVDVAVDVDIVATVEVDVGVEVAVAIDVEVDVGVEVDTTIEVEVDVEVGPDVGVVVEIDTEVEVDVAVEVSAGCGLGVEVEGGGKKIVAFVGVGFTATVFVGDAIVIGVVVCVASIVPVIMGVVNDMPVVDGNDVPVASEAPGVRKTLIHAGFVRMAGSTGSMNPLGLRVRKSLFGSRLDSILVSSSQRGVKRRAHSPASRMQKSPNRRMRTMITQSRLSCSNAFIDVSIIDRQPHVNRGARIDSFVMARAFEPDAPVVCVHNAARDGKPQPGTTTFEFGLAR